MIPLPARSLPAVAAMLLLTAAPLRAQLRPTEPLEWRLFDSRTSFTGGIGAGILFDQNASLAGTKGRLLELGNFQLAWRTGRIGLELAGTMSRQFTDQEVVRPPAFGADPPTGQLRHDAGDIRASTIIRLTAEQLPATLVLRFGTRLPTTSDEPGLDRDRTDFFATVGARYATGHLALAAESGIGINGTRETGYDQSDVWTYAFTLNYRLGPITPMALLLGQQDGHPASVRGNEDLNELRVGLRAGDRYWVQALAVRGLTEFSPSGGFLVMVGVHR